MSPLPHKRELPSAVSVKLKHAKVGAWAYHYGGLDPRQVTAILEDGMIEIAIGDLRPKVPAKNYSYVEWRDPS